MVVPDAAARRAAAHYAILLVVLAGVLAASAATVYAGEAIRAMVRSGGLTRSRRRGARAIRAFVVETTMAGRARQLGTSAVLLEPILTCKTQGHFCDII